MKTNVFYLHALSALHVGVGQAVGSVDLPIARCRATNLPLVPGSAIKGVLRDEFQADEQHLLFGPESITDAESAHAAALAFGDAHLLVFPVRSMAGIVAFVSCPFVLERYANDLRRTGKNDLPQIPEPGAKVLVTNETVLKLSGDRIVLEDLDFSFTPGADKWAEYLAKAIYPQASINSTDQNQKSQDKARMHFQKRFLILNDDDFAFLAETATEVRARIRIDDDRGVVQKGALWYEENLPAESVLWGMMAASPSRMKSKALDAEAVWTLFKKQIQGERLLQIGGKATVGRGLVRFIQ
jgi:CRISPR-associated protein Cmr4